MAVGFPTRNITFVSSSGKRLGVLPLGGILPDGTITHTMKRQDLYRTVYDAAVERGIRIEHGRGYRRRDYPRQVSTRRARHPTRIRGLRGHPSTASRARGCSRSQGQPRQKTRSRNPSYSRLRPHAPLCGLCPCWRSAPWLALRLPVRLAAAAPLECSYFGAPRFN